MLELIVGLSLLGSIVASVFTTPEKPKPKSEPSDSMNAIEALLLVAVLNKSLNDEEREKLNKAIEALKS